MSTKNHPFEKGKMDQLMHQFYVKLTKSLEDYMEKELNKRTKKQILEDFNKLYDEFQAYKLSKKPLSQDPKEIPVEPSIVFIERIVVDFRASFRVCTKLECEEKVNELQKTLLRTLCGMIDGMKKQGAKAFPSFSEELRKELERIRLERR